MKWQQENTVESKKTFEYLFSLIEKRAATNRQVIVKFHTTNYNRFLDSEEETEKNVEFYITACENVIAFHKETPNYNINEKLKN